MILHCVRSTRTEVHVNNNEEWLENRTIGKLVTPPDSLIHVVNITIPGKCAVPHIPTASTPKTIELEHKLS